MKQYHNKSILLALFMLIQTTLQGDGKHQSNSTTPIFTWHRKVETTPAPKNANKISLRNMATPCVTPNDDNGYCLSIKDCHKLYNQLENPNATEFLKASGCGPSKQDLKNPKVCCGKYENYKHLVKQNPLPKKCGVQNVNKLGRIMGGVTAKLGEFPWMARLMHKNYYNNRIFGCSGFLISSKFVLTAAHCLSYEDDAALGPLYEVELGEHDTDTVLDCFSKGTPCADPPQVIRIKETVIHPKYNKSSRNFHYDIGLIHLRKSANLTDWVYPICLEKHHFNTSSLYWISGWGKTERYDQSNLKMKLSLPYYPHRDCVMKYRTINIDIIKSQICAGSEKMKDSCSGDSGGPLMSIDADNKFFADGIVSYGIGCGRQGWPGIYTDISSYLEWIKDEMLKRVQPKVRARANKHHKKENHTEKAKL